MVTLATGSSGSSQDISLDQKNATVMLERVDIQDVQMNALIRDSKDMKARGVCS